MRDMTEAEHRAVAKGRQAEQECILFAEAFESLRAELVTGIEKCNPEEANKLNRFIASLQVIASVQARLRAIALDGKNAKTLADS